MATKFLLVAFCLLLSNLVHTTGGETLEASSTGNLSPAVSLAAGSLPTQTPGVTNGIRNSLFFNDRIRRAYFVIQAFKKTVTADPFNVTKTWRGPDICRLNDTTKYVGFYCDRLPRTAPNDSNALAVAAVDFNSFRIKAPSVTQFIQGLPDLAFFHANSNGFRGSLAINFTKLPLFYELDISNNRISGAFPTEVFNIKSVTFLDLRFNSFSGVLPPQLFIGYKLVEVIFLNNNGFSQPIPANLGRSPVRYLTFANNQFTGRIPRSIRFAANTLTEVLFLNNQLSGCVPYEIGFLTRATVFDAGFNSLTGPIPFSLGCMRRVEQLSFASNKLYGQVPEVVCRLPRLLNLSLSNNYFTALGPACRRLATLGVLDDRNNCILGRPHQRSPAACSAFFAGPLQCSTPPNYMTIPCNVATSNSSVVVDEDDKALAPLSYSDEEVLPRSNASAPPAPSPSRSYAALTKHNG